MSEAVNHPAHYGGESDPFEVIKILEAKLTPEQFIGFCRGNALKYTLRAGKKDPAKAVEDLKKAVWYIQREVDFMERSGGPKVVKDPASAEYEGLLESVFDSITRMAQHGSTPTHIELGLRELRIVDRANWNPMGQKTFCGLQIIRNHIDDSFVRLIVRP